MKKISLILLKKYWFTGKEKVQLELIKGLNKLKNALERETDETREMLEIYYLSTQGLATKEQKKKANTQFRNLIKTLGLGVIALLPLAPLTLPLAVKLGEKLGVDIIPDSFKRDYSKK